MKRIFALILTLAFFVSVPVVVLADGAPDPGTYVVEGKDQTDPLWTDDAAKTAVLGAGSFFTVHYSQDSKLTTTTKAWKEGKVTPDGYEITAEDAYNANADSVQRFFFGAHPIRYEDGAVTSALEFTTRYPATVKVWWVNAASEDNQLVILDANGDLVEKTDLVQPTTSAPRITVFEELSQAGTYYLGPVGQSTGWILKVQVAESAKSAKPALSAKSAVQDAGGKLTLPLKKALTQAVTYRLYPDATDGQALKTVEAQIGDQSLVLEMDPLSASRVYYLSAQSGATSESDRVPVTLRPRRVGTNPVAGISLDLKSTLAVGEELALTAQITATDPTAQADDYTVTWSTDPAQGGAAEVSGSTLKGARLGRATVTATVTDTEDPGITFSASAPMTVTAAETTTVAAPYVFDAAALGLMGVGTYKTGEQIKYDDFFTLDLTPNARVERYPYTWEEGTVTGYTGPEYSGTHRITLGGRLLFTTTGPATVELWWAYQGHDTDTGDDIRQIGIFTGDDTKRVAVTNLTQAPGHGERCYSKLELAQGGSYGIHPDGSDNYFYRVKVTPKSVTRTGSMSVEGTVLDWGCDETGAFTVSPEALSPGEVLWAAGFDSDGRFTGVKALTAQHPTAQVDAGVSKLRLFWLNSAQKPQSEAATAWEPTPEE